jgi:hypothetical protein
MTKPTRVRASDIQRMIQGATAGGMPLGSFSIELCDGTLRLSPVAAIASTDAAHEAERRMKEAFGA